MKIAIIGAGWIGCHLAHKLKNNHKITIYDKEDIFSGSSSNNQNRLHLGFIMHEIKQPETCAK